MPPTVARFLTPVRTEQVAKRRFKVLTPLVYDSPLLGMTVTVPPGFVTDFESVPRWLPVTHALLYGEAHAAAVLHDWVYQTHQVNHRPVSRREADELLFEATGASGPGIEPVPRWKRWLFWLGVRAGGGFGAWATGPRRIQIWDRRRAPRPAKLRPEERVALLRMLLARTHRKVP